MTPNGYKVVPVPMGMGANRNPQPMRQGKPTDGTCREPLTKTAATLDLVKKILAYGVAPGVVLGGAAAIAPEIKGDGLISKVYNTAVRNPVTTGLTVASIGAGLGSHFMKMPKVVNPEWTTANNAFESAVRKLVRGNVPASTYTLPKNPHIRMVEDAARLAMKEHLGQAAGVLGSGALGGVIVNEYDRPNSWGKDFMGGTNRTVLPSDNPYAATQRPKVYNPYVYSALGGIGGAGLSMIGQQLAKGSINPMDVAIAGMGGSTIGGGGAYLANQLNVDYNKVKTNRSKPVI